MIAIPFSCADRSSMHDLKGLIRLEDEAVVLEYRVEYWGCYTKAKVHESRISRDLITAASFKEGWFSDTLTLQTASLKAWQDFMGSVDGRARLKIEKADREAAREIAALLAPGKVGEPIDEFA